MMKILHILFTLVLLGIISTQLLGISWENKTVLESHQPKDIDYKSYDPYTLRIVKRQLFLGSKMVLIVAKDIEPSYGYAINYPADIIFEKEQIVVTWSPEGIVVTTSLGTQIIIPKKNFTGGR